MQVFKNPVGRPPKDLKKKRVITVLVIALALVLGGSFAVINILGIDLASLMGNSVVSSKVKVISGELTSDGIIDEEDYTFLEQLSYMGLYLVNGDINLDGELDELDIEALRKYLDSETKSQYSITFNAAGGMGKMPNPVQVLSDTEIELPTNNYTRNGYLFTGWTGSDGKDYEDEQTGVILTSDLILTAKWEKFDEVVEEEQNGFDSESDENEEKIDEANEEIEDEENNSVEESIDEEETSVEIPQAPVEEKPKEVEIVFDKNTGTSGSMANQRITYGTTTKITKNRFSKQGYTFKGWMVSGLNGRYLGCTDGKSCAYTANNATLKWYATSQIKNYMIIPDNVIITGKVKEILENTIKTGEKITLKAVWEANKYTITFNAGQGKFANTNTRNKSSYTQLVSYDGKYILPPTQPTRDGYKFLGWNTQVNGKGENITVNSVLKRTSNQILYAKWEKIPAKKYTITFDAAGGNCKQKNMTVTSGEKYGSLPNVTRGDSNKGYRFNGWYTEKNGKGTKVTKDSVVNITKDSTLYAYWRPVKILMIGPSNITRYNKQRVDITGPNGESRTIDDYTLDNKKLEFIVGSGLGIPWELDVSDKKHKKSNGDYILGGTRQAYDIIDNDNKKADKYDYVVVYFLSGNTLQTYEGKKPEDFQSYVNADFDKYSTAAKNFQNRYLNKNNIRVFIVGLNPINCMFKEDDKLYCKDEVKKVETKKATKNSETKYSCPSTTTIDGKTYNVERSGTGKNTTCTAKCGGKDVCKYTDRGGTMKCGSGWSKKGNDTICTKKVDKVTTSKTTTTSACPKTKKIGDNTYNVETRGNECLAKCGGKEVCKYKRRNGKMQCGSGWSKKGNDTICTKKVDKVTTSKTTTTSACPKTKKIGDNTYNVETRGNECLAKCGGKEVCKNKLRDTKKECGKGWTYKNGSCVKNVSVNTKTEDSYTCPKGYTKSGSGKNTICSKNIYEDPYEKGARSNAKYIAYLSRFNNKKSDYIDGYIGTYDFSESFIGKNNVETKNNTTFYEDTIHYKLAGSSRVYAHVMDKLDDTFNAY